MTIYRTRKERDFVVIDNAMLRDPKLSLKAKGLLTYALSRPDDWKFSISGLALACRDGEDSVRSAVQELEKAGYIRRTRTRTKGRFQEVVYDIYERPVPVPPAQENPVPEEPVPDIPVQEKSPKPNIDVPNTDILNMDLTPNPSIDPGSVERQIRKQIEYDILCQRYDPRLLEDLVSVMAEVMLCSGKRITVSKDKIYPADYVLSCLAKIGPMHIEQIMDSLQLSRAEIRNIRGYLLTALINAANTMDMGYQYGEAYTL